MRITLLDLEYNVILVILTYLHHHSYFHEIQTLDI